MILLDTDHLNVFAFPVHPRYALLTGRLRTNGGHRLATTVVNIEEQMRVESWIA
jgi:hypothetical protein